MRSRVVTKVISAAAVALIVELTDLALDKTALSDKKFRIVRKVLKTGVGAASGALLGKILYDAAEADTDTAGSSQPVPEAARA